MKNDIAKFIKSTKNVVKPCDRALKPRFCCNEKIWKIRL